MTYRLINIGRGKFNGDVTVKSDSELRREVKKHLASKLFDIEWDGDMAAVTVGFRTVGLVCKI